MSIHVALHHKTHYKYDRLVGHAPHVVRLRPAPHCRTRILAYSQKVIGGEHFINWQQDPFSNWNARLVFPEPLAELCIEVEVVAEMSVYNPFDFFLEDSASHYPFQYDAKLRKDLAPFVDPLPLTPRFAALLDSLRREILAHPEAAPHTASFDSERPPGDQQGGRHPSIAHAHPDATSGRPLRTIDFLVALNQRLQSSVRYLIRLEPGVQTPEETLEKASGSCRDSAWLLVQVLRHLGLAARFVSGYLIQLAPDVKSLDGPSGTAVDFTDLHAWCEVYLPGAGWIGLDPTSGLLAGEGHIPLSCTPEPSTAAPVTGAVDECESTLVHEMRVTRVHESPRVTKPYTEEQWERIDRLGRTIDADLKRQDVRLTMGGEPTFVSVDDPDGPEWNFTAVSPAKRVLSGRLIRRLREKFAPGALLHYGQGKWYPGEPLPRWALAAFWRKDGIPVWKEDSLIADESRNYGHGAREARELSLRIAQTLGVDSRHLMAGYEDAFYYTWKERRLPSNVTPENSRLESPQERDRIARIFQKGLGQVVGYALPIRCEPSSAGGRWISGAWFLRDGEILWLIPGDSPMGLRLPLGSIPWVAEKEFPWLV
ncbi:MAG TPA: IMP dehydrogenase, partial [Verrucomicrobiales bacterium]|nr:IMP dehydrogenase [Verrucomicrobiales bacterium]